MPKALKMPEIDIQDIEYLVCCVAMLWRRLLHVKIKSLDISITEKRILFCIGRYPGYTQIKIANLLDLEPQNLLRELDKLEKKGLIKKSPDTKDRRVNCLKITSKAEKVIQEIQSISDKIKPEILSGMSYEKTQTLVEHLSDVRKNLMQMLDKLG